MIQCIDVFKKENCYEIMALDVLPDNNGNYYMLDVSINPFIH